MGTLSIYGTVHAFISKISFKGVDDPFFIMNIDQVFKCFELWTTLFPTIRPFYGKRTGQYAW